MIIWFFCIHLFVDACFFGFFLYFDYQVKSNAVRALGYISRILKCPKSKFQDISVDYNDCMTDLYLNNKNIMVCQQHCTSNSLQEFNRLERIVQAFISCINTGNVKVPYCYNPIIWLFWIFWLLVINPLSPSWTWSLYYQVQWNVCHALGNLFLNETLRLQDMDWYVRMKQMLLMFLMCIAASVFSCYISLFFS